MIKRKVKATREVSIVLLCVLSLLPINALAEYTLSGRVVDETEKPIKGAEITLVGRNLTTTNTSGFYVIHDIAPGTYTIKVRARGYKTKSEYNVYIKGNETKNFALTKIRTPTPPPIYDYAAVAGALCVILLAGLYLFRKRE